MTGGLPVPGRAGRFLVASRARACPSDVGPADPVTFTGSLQRLSDVKPPRSAWTTLVVTVREPKIWGMSESSPSFHGLRVAAFESRRADEVARLIERFAGAAFVTPSLREVPIAEATAAADFGHRLLVGEIGVVMFLTGVGFQYLLTTVERQLHRERYLHALADIVTIARGPKVAHAMREVGLQPTYVAAEPHTWRELLTTVDQQVPVDNQVVAIQEYGESNISLVAGLEARGARVVTVPVYRWDLPDESAAAGSAVRALTDGRIDVVLFSSAIHVTHVLQVARQLGMEERLRQAMWQMVVGSIGPTTSEMLRQHDLPVDIEPEHAKLGHLVRDAAQRAAELLEKKQASPGTDGRDDCSCRRIRRRPGTTARL